MERVPLSEVVRHLSKRNVAQLSKVSRLFRPYGTERRRAVRKIAGTVKAVSKFRPKKTMTENTKRMVHLVRILSLFPKTSQQGYPLRKRLAARVFSEPYTRTAFGNIKIGNVESNNFSLLIPCTVELFVTVSGTRLFYLTVEHTQLNNSHVVHKGCQLCF